MQRRWIACVVGAVTLAACSGGDDDAASTTAAATTVASAPATTSASEPEATDPPATTEAPATTAAPVETTEAPVETTAPPVETTEAPVETTVPVTTSTLAEADPAAIEAEWREAVRLFRVAQMDPTNMAAVEAAVRYRSGENRIDLGFLLAEMRDLGRRILPEPAAPIVLSLEVPPTPADDGSGQYVMTVCEVDAWVLVSDDADGETTVINDSVISSRDELLMNFFEGRWTILSRQRLESAEGVGLCDG